MNINDYDYVGRWLDDGSVPSIQEVYELASQIVDNPIEYDDDLTYRGVIEEASQRLEMDAGILMHTIFIMKIKELENEVS